MDTSGTTSTASNVAQKLVDAAKDVELTAVLDGVVGLIPMVLPVVVAFIAFRKGYGFLKSSLRGA